MDLEFIQHLAELSGICFTRQELEEMAGDMAEIMALMDKIKDVDKTLPLYRQEAIQYSELRQDVPAQNQGAGRQFTVPKIFG